MWRKVWLTIVVMMLFSPAGLLPAAGDPRDSPGSRDPRLFTRMPGFHIYNATELEFDRYEFVTGGNQKEVVEGHHLEITYYANEGVKLPSGLQIIRNYQNAIKNIGGELVYGYEDGGTEYATLKAVAKDFEIWVEVIAGGNGMYSIHLLEKQAMKQEVVADAAAMASSLGTTGRVAVYGIYFNTDSAELKAESETALKEIVALLQADGALKVYVVGHTDNVGGFEHNVRLSQNRAAGVVSALIKRGVAPTRLLPCGDGPTAPVAANDTEAGRAKNRRVELVKQ